MQQRYEAVSIEMAQMQRQRWFGKDGEEQQQEESGGCVWTWRHVWCFGARVGGAIRES